jgi:hexulose-6-phosphate isomerase
VTPTPGNQKQSFERARQFTECRMDRRAFLQSAAIAAAAVSTPAFAQSASASGALPASTGELKGRLYKSLMIGMFTEKNLSWMEKFKVLRDCGFEGVELSSPGNLPLKEIREAQDATGLMVGEIVNSTHWTIRFSDPDPHKREQALDSLSTSIKDAHALGASTVLLVIGKVTPDATHDEVWKRSIPEIRKAIPTAAKYGVRIAVENVWNGFCENPKDWAQYIDELADGSPWVGAHFDIGNHIKFSPPAEWIRVLNKRILKLHVKDFAIDKNKDRGGTFCKLGEGDANWPEVRKALREINYTGYAAAEVGGGDREVMKDVVARMNSVLGL